VMPACPAYTAKRPSSPATRTVACPSVAERPTVKAK
jgi:hypothetical protein